MVAIPRPDGFVHAGAFSDEALSGLLKAIGYVQPIQYTANGAIGPHTQQRALLNKASALAMTLAAPTSGPQSQGGDDYLELELLSVSDAAHVITVTNLKAGVVGTKTTLTFAASAGCVIRLMAWGGKWHVVGAPQGVTLS